MGWDFLSATEPEDQALSSLAPQQELHYSTYQDFRSDLELVRTSLEATGLSCEPLNRLLNKADLWLGLASLDIRQESTRHSEASLNSLAICSCPD